MFSTECDYRIASRQSAITPTPPRKNQLVRATTMQEITSEPAAARTLPERLARLSHRDDDLAHLAEDPGELLRVRTEVDQRRGEGRRVLLPAELEPPLDVAARVAAGQLPPLRIRAGRE